MEKLGIDPKLFITQIVNFAIMLFVLTKLLYKPILKSLEARRKKIEEGLAFAEKAKQEEEKLSRKREEVLKDARDEARVILANAKKDGHHLKEELLEDGKKELEASRVRTEKELQAKYSELEKQLVSRTVDIAAEMVKKLLPSVLGSEEQHKLITRELTKLEKHHERG